MIETLQRQIDNCPTCDGLITEEDIKVGRPVFYERLGARWVRQIWVAHCPHCGRSTTKTIRNRLGVDLIAVGIRRKGSHARAAS